MGQRLLVRGLEIWINNSNILQEGLPFILEIRVVEKVVLSIPLSRLQIGFGESRK